MHPAIQRGPYLALVSGILAVSTGAIFARMADAPSLVIAAYRVGLATLVLLPVGWFSARHDLRRLSGSDLCLAVSAGFFLALHFAAWIASLKYTSVANSVVLVNTNPLWVGLLTPLVARERLGRGTIRAIGLSVVGGVIIGIGDFDAGRGALFGDALALAGSWCAAAYLLIGRRLRRKLSLTAYIVVCYGSAAVILWSLVLAAGLPVGGFSNATWACFWAMAIITQLIGHTCFNFALKWFSAGAIAVSLLGEPIGATILAYVLFDEGLTWTKALGGVLILSAIYFAAAGEGAEHPATARGDI
jgi:drug/metabolite transporter (DMT)-like permease